MLVENQNEIQMKRMAVLKLRIFYFHLDMIILVHFRLINILLSYFIKEVLHMITLVNE